MSITLEQVKKSEEITSYIRKADESLSALGFTEHSFAHVGLVSAQASAILKTLGYDDRTCELAAIAGWLHDIGNVINRIDHAQSGAVMASVAVMKVLSRKTPALLNRISIEPSVFTAVSKIACTPSRVPTSARTAFTRPGASFNSSSRESRALSSL